MEQLGINFSSLVIQIINFVVLAIILTKFLYQPIIKKLDERQKQIESTNRLQQSLEEQHRKSQQDHQQIIQEAHLEAKKIIFDAKNQATEIQKEQLTETEHELRKLKEKFETQQAQHKAKLESELNEKSLSMAKGLAREILIKSLAKDAQTELIEEAIKKFKSS